MERRKRLRGQIENEAGSSLSPYPRDQIINEIMLVKNSGRNRYHAAKKIARFSITGKYDIRSRTANTFYQP